MKKSRIVSCTMLLLILVTILSMITGCSTATKKIPIPTVEKNVYIYDEDNIIDDSTEKELNKMLVELEQKTETEFAVISVESLLDKSIEDYANNLFNTLGIGKKGKDNGVLLLISRSDKKVRLEIGRGLEGCLNDSKCGRILDDYFVPYRENDEYTKATKLTVSAVLKVLCEEYNISITGLNTESIQIEESDELTFGQMIIIIIIIIAILVIIEWITGHILGDGFGDGLISNIILSSGSSSSGGGFGGGSFGGGCSGGGGASR